MGKADLGRELSEQIDQAIERLQEQLALGHSEDFLKMIEFYSRFHNYSLANCILIAMQFPDAIQVAGYNKWREQGFQVKQGERGIRILAPRIKKTEDKDTGEKTSRVIGYLCVYVYDLSQTAEYPEKQPPTIYKELPGDYEALYRHIWSAIEQKGIEVSERPLASMHNGYYTDGQIVVSTAIPVAHRVKTLLHEYVHSVLHPNQAESEKYTKREREWQAETAAFAVASAIGLEHNTSAEYLISWKLTTEKLGDMIKDIHTHTKRVMKDLDLLQPLGLNLYRSAAAD